MSIVIDWSIYPNFKQSEFTCKCGCGMNRINKKLLGMLQKARTRANIPFTITSGCRCYTHNSKVSTSHSGDHISDLTNICFGVDISITSPRNRFIIFSALRREGFNRIGLSEKFIHAGIGKKFGGRGDDDVIWLYD